MAIETREITRRQKKDLLVKIRNVIARKLNLITKIKRTHTGKEIAEALCLDPARISEILSPKPLPLAEATLRKLIGGGIVKVAEIVKKLNPTPKEREYLSRFRTYEDQNIFTEINELSQEGIDVAALLKRIRTLQENGINVSDELDNLLSSVE